MLKHNTLEHLTQWPKNAGKGIYIRANNSRSGLTTLLAEINKMDKKKIGVTEVVLRDGHQSLLATRLRYEDMESILSHMDSIGFWSVESWGGAIFDSCIRYLGEDPWERIRNIKSKMPNTPQQMLLRGQNLLGYKHYSDEIVFKFIEKSKENGVCLLYTSPSPRD